MRALRQATVASDAMPPTTLWLGNASADVTDIAASSTAQIMALGSRRILTRLLDETGNPIQLSIR
jgi:hypothetical protein